MRFMRANPGLQVDLSFDDRYVNLVEQGLDLAVRMGRLADSTLGARHLGMNPWVVVAAPSYLAAHPAPTQPTLLAAAREGMGIAALPCYVAHESIESGVVLPLLLDWSLPAPEVHAVYPSPRMVPAKVTEFIAWLQGQFEGAWWSRAHGAPELP